VRGQSHWLRAGFTGPRASPWPSLHGFTFTSVVARIINISKDLDPYAIGKTCETAITMLLEIEADGLYTTTSWPASLRFRFQVRAGGHESLISYSDRFQQEAFSMSLYTSDCRGNDDPEHTIVIRIGWQ
jgi:hypothetical protein